MPEIWEIIAERTPEPERWLTPVLFRDTRELSHRYMAAGPFGHLILDKFFEPSIAEALDSAIRAFGDNDYPVSYRSLAQKKLQLGAVATKAPHIFPIYETLMCPALVRVLEEICGIKNLTADRQFTGAGLHRYVRGGFAEIHLDASRHPLDAASHHRLNLLIFLNREWRPGWGGELIFWSTRNGRPDAPARIIEPRFNRAVIFGVSKTAWHSVARVKCPENQSRNSIAIHYFNSSREPDDEPRPRSVIWHSTHGWRRQFLFELYNRAMKIAKPYGRQLRRFRPDKFDGASAFGDK
jgi:Rps23 Pro-64 3,4-dihydroxylase Tpa1-like proline 4-hydroxylase